MAATDRYAAETEEWVGTVGKAIIAFGELELITYKCLAHIPSDKICETSSQLLFARRVELLVEILEGRSPLPPVVSEFVAMLKRARELAKTRNDIAHNPVVMNMFVNKSTGDILLERSIATARGGRVIDIAAAKEFAADVEDLVASMWLQIGKIAEGGVQAWRS